MIRTQQQLADAIVLALRPLAPNGKLWNEEVGPINAIAGSWFRRQPQPPANDVRRVSPKGIALMHGFESCKLIAYPDPGSRNGEPWTIGWGATGPGITRGTQWTQEQADERFRQDLARFEDGVNRLLGNAPTTQDQFDALVSLAYNIGLDEDTDTIAEGLGDSSLLRKHKAGDYEGAADAFGSWVYNDGKKLNGLVRRRAAEAKMYRGEA